jgi:hypothetical protein
MPPIALSTANCRTKLVPSKSNFWSRTFVVSASPLLGGSHRIPLDESAETLFHKDAGQS